MSLNVVSLPGAWGVPSVSPFCLKLETWLRMADIPYDVRYTPAPTKAPKGKAPYIELDGEKLGDTQFIIPFLTEKHGVTLGSELSAEQRALALGLRRMIEEHTYFGIVWSRWIDEPGWLVLRSCGIFDTLPGPLGSIVPPLARRFVRKQLHQQGVGRHTREEILGLVSSDIDALATTLGSDGYFFGHPSLLDASAYGLLAGVVFGGVDGDFQNVATRHDNLVAYCERMRARYWSDGT